MRKARTTSSPSRSGSPGRTSPSPTRSSTRRSTNRPTHRSSATGCPCTRSARARRASWCAAPGSWRPWRRSPTRSRCTRRIRCPPGPRPMRWPSRFRWTPRGCSSCAVTARPRPVRTVFDRPLSTRFDEQDAFVIFDDVEIPRERLFIDGRIDLYNTVGTTGLRDNLTNQTTIRALTKLEFAYGLATRMAEAIGDASPATQEMLGELLDYVEVSRSAVLLSAEHGRDVGDGVWFPDGRPLAPMRSLLATWFPRVNEIIMLIGSHNLLATPEPAAARRRHAPAADRRVPARREGDRRRGAGRAVPPGLGLRRLEPRRPQRSLRALLSHLGGAQPHHPPRPERRPQPRLCARRRDPGGWTQGRRPRHDSVRTRLTEPGHANSCD